MARVSVSVGTGRAYSDGRSEKNKYSHGKCYKMNMWTDFG